MANLSSSKIKALIVLCFIGMGIFGCLENSLQADQTFENALTVDPLSGDKALANAFEHKQSNLQVGGLGRVIKVLPDDLKGSRHQRFLLRMATGQTLLVAHNIDLAPRINTLKAGDKVEFYGEYEWNKKGGVIHWTHHDPRGRHEGGWLVHNGKVYK
ncbi:DUF3465 domain-containing protein [Parendozoicomonas sp. Alg238-R29]|uniref:DUF3465 domain-containing protein n=1 Tax=Parendozoicomonas sp. Alg238-R29 TaxID=2993446 RepID=UPI00248E4B66|nr:DUF3465 domain-containing protein [Parendozoicomonas sp. Alg238-R29]